jgi:hypothetical protein
VAIVCFSLQITPDESIDFPISDTAFISSRGGWMYCDDSRVTPVDPKEVVVSLPYHRLFHRAHPTHFTRANPLTSYTIRESKPKLYVHIFPSHFHFHLLLHSPTVVIMLCIILCNYTDYA